MILRVLVFMFFITLHSCDYIYFVNPQPVDTKELHKFSEQHVGKWKQDGDTDAISIHDQKVVFPVDGGKDSICLSDSNIVLKSIKGYSILSVRHEDICNNCWEIFAFRIEDDSLSLYTFYENEESEPQLVPKLEKIINVNSVPDKDGTVDYYIIDPTKREFKKILKNQIFRGERYGRVK